MQAAKFETKMRKAGPVKVGEREGASVVKFLQTPRARVEDLAIEIGIDRWHSWCNKERDTLIAQLCKLKASAFSQDSELEAVVEAIP